jgi:hypothetical protein
LKRNARLNSIAKMNSTLAIEPLKRSEPQFLSSSPDTTFESQTERGGSAIPFWRFHLKLEERFDAFIATLSVVYLIGGIGFGGLLLFYALSR